MPITDKRNKLCAEILAGMRAVKLFSWETPFVDKILKLREREMYFIKWELMYFMLGVVMMIITPGFAMVVAYSSYTAPEGKTISAADAFASLALFNLLRFPLNQMGTVIATTIQAYVALKRVSAFLCKGATPSLAAASAPKEVKVPPPSLAGEESLQLREASFGWSSYSADVQLENLSSSIKKGALICVVGSVGSGKSTLINSLLGETDLKAGTFHMAPGQTIGYTSQEPFILNATVKDNILFGKPFDDKWYREVLKACCLLPDLQIFVEGDMTMIGERGITLSGGQKARICLARATYARPTLVLLDDPLSALDSDTGAKIYKNLLAPGGLMSTATRVLVTHATQFLALADRMLVLHEGRLVFADNFSMLQAAIDGGLLDEEARRQMTLLTDTMQEQVGEEASRKDSSSAAPQPSTTSKTRSTSSANGMQKTDSLMTAESRQKGTMSLQTYNILLVASGGLAWAGLLSSALTLERFTFICCDFWLAIWTSHPDESPGILTLPAADSASNVRFYLTVYAVFVSVNAFFVFLRLWLAAFGGARATQSLFASFLSAVFKTDMQFFETTPIGRVLNRFTFDTDVCDFILVVKLCSTIASVGWMVSGIAVMTAAVPWMLLVLAPMGFYYFSVVQKYRTACVDLQRLDSTSRSPIQSHLQESLDGNHTIRAFQQELGCKRQAFHLLDANNRALYAFILGNRWLGVRLELLGSLVSFSISMLCWSARDTIDPGIAAVAILWGFTMTLTLNIMCVESTAMEARMTSVERLDEYSRLLPEQVAGEGVEPEPSWPSRGGVEFRNVSLRYRQDLPLALRSFSVQIEPGEHVGVCGRTGAGKSTLAVALFRLVEVCEGGIYVDGVNLRSLPLSVVRGRGLCIIPQDPTIFSGTVRFNLDPFEQASDVEIWDALELVKMKAAVQRSESGLHCECEVGGANFSAGERQLLCFARALLRKPKVLLLDEATASVDKDTDAFIQNTLRMSLKGTTLIAIAHRLDTIMDYDRILVVAGGGVQEVGKPSVLLQNPASALSKLVDSTGAASSTHLRTLAKVEVEGPL